MWDPHPRAPEQQIPELCLFHPLLPPLVFLGNKCLDLRPRQDRIPRKRGGSCSQHQLRAVFQHRGKNFPILGLWGVFLATQKMQVRDGFGRGISLEKCLDGRICCMGVAGDGPNLDLFEFKNPPKNEGMVQTPPKAWAGMGWGWIPFPGKCMGLEGNNVGKGMENIWKC